VLRGALGFTAVSVAGFAPWAVFGRPLYRLLGEAGMYGVCAVVFLGLSGLILHPLLAGPGSLRRFYKLFLPAFAAYSVAWIGGWMALHGNAGSWLGLFLGAVCLGGLLARGLGALKEAPFVIAVLFVLNAAGYFGGGWMEGMLMHARGLPLEKSVQAMLAMSLWGVGYGFGLGAGLGIAFWRCQRQPVR
jgi:hypothetical protein